MMVEIREDDLSGPEIAELLQVHQTSMAAQSPPESTHALDLAGLRALDIAFWSAWIADDLVGSGALKELDAFHGEIKSMHTKATARGQGVAKHMLEHIVSEAVRRGYRRLSLETGSMRAFEPARALYRQYGFTPCGPFANYRNDPNSIYMSKVLNPEK